MGSNLRPDSNGGKVSEGGKDSSDGKARHPEEAGAKRTATERIALAPRLFTQCVIKEAPLAQPRTMYMSHRAQCRGWKLAVPDPLSPIQLSKQSLDPPETPA